MSSKKVFVLGLDGASPDVIESLIRAGRLPTFKRLKEEGSMGPLRTTIPPITGSAWSSFMTGKNPGKHGIFDFTYRKEGTYHLVPINSQRRDGRSFWSWAGGAGKKVGVFNVPVTYPPERVNGFMVTGMLTPSHRTDFTHPPSLAGDLDRVTDGYQMNIIESYSEGRGERFLSDLYTMTEKKIKATEYLFGMEDWDLFVAVFEGIDLIQHELWHAWDPTHFRHDPSQGNHADAIPRFYEKMDGLLKRVSEEWTDQRWTLIVMSDHGAGPLRKLIFINNFLMRKGLLRLKREVRSSFRSLLFHSGIAPMSIYNLLLPLGLGRLKRRVRYRQKANWLRSFFLSFEDVNWNETLAYSIGNTAGQIYLNVKGREPNGIVEPGKMFEEVRERIIEELRNLVDEETGEKVVSDIFRKEEIYVGPHLREAPDIIFFSKAFEIAAFGEYEFASTRILERSQSISASHRMDGLLMMKGEGIRRGGRIEGAQIIDLAPSVLYLLGLPVSKEMDGKVIQNAFEEQVLLAKGIQFIEEGAFDFRPQEVYSEQEEEELKKQLKVLGYFE